MTEAEALTKWCPFARMKVAQTVKDGAPSCNEPQTTYNRIAINAQSSPFIADQARCIASACMAWRRVMDDDLPTAPGERMAATEQGFCGLAGSSL
jgi:hypothetical protein